MDVLRFLLLKFKCPAIKASCAYAACYSVLCSSYAKHECGRVVLLTFRQKGLVLLLANTELNYVIPDAVPPCVFPMLYCHVYPRYCAAVSIPDIVLPCLCLMPCCNVYPSAMLPRLLYVVLPYLSPLSFCYVYRRCRAAVTIRDVILPCPSPSCVYPRCHSAALSPLLGLPSVRGGGRGPGGGRRAGRL